MASSANDADRVFSTNTKNIPPLGTEVFVVMSPRRLPAPAKARKPAKPAP